MDVVVLTKADSTYGGHSGYYTEAFRYGPDAPVRVRKVIPDRGRASRLVGKLFSCAIQAGQRDQGLAAAELRILAMERLRTRTVFHVAVPEDHFPLLTALKRDRPRWTTTIHFPPGHWRPECVSALRHFGRIITLCRRDADFVDSQIGTGRTSVILHGVDLEYFHPDPGKRSPEPRFIFSGKWLRDFETAGRVFSEALQLWPTLQIDVVVAKRWTSGTALERLVTHPRVHFHEGISDAELLRLNQQAWFLVMPLEETSANNAIVEALACGTIPVVSAVGGVADYGGGTVFPTVCGKAEEDYLSALSLLVNDPAERARVSKDCRDFAEDNLDWRLARARHVEVYRGLLEAKGCAV